MFINKKIDYQLAWFLRKAANRLSPKNELGEAGYFNVGEETLPKNSKRAAIIYTVAGVEKYVRGINLEKDPFFNKHTMYWESVEMVKILNRCGYIVDCFDDLRPVKIGWEKYNLVIDVSNHLKDCPPIEGQRKIYYSACMHWLTWNRAELERIRMFYERTGIMMPWNRQLPPIISDEYADYVTYFGTDLQKNSFSRKPQKIQINISAVFVPLPHKKDIKRSRNKFLWLGGGGLVHKGLDLTIETFMRLPEAELFIAGNMKNEPRFWQWAEPILKRCRNIHYLGWMDVASPEFNEIAENCIGTVYLSGAEGGPGSVAQILHNGLIPIVTPSALVRAEVLGYKTDDTTDIKIIQTAVESVKILMNTPDKELAEKSDQVRTFARETHTRESYSRSLSDFISQI